MFTHSSFFGYFLAQSLGQEVGEIRLLAVDGEMSKTKDLGSYSLGLKSCYTIH